MTPVEAADPHHDVAVAEAGAPLRRAKAAVVMLHGRGATAGDMLSLAEALAQPDLAYLAPQAAGRSWYPYSFLAPIARNEPFLSSALRMLDGLLGRLGTEGYPSGRVVLLGFSQGACLALEYAARRALRYGGLVGLSGGLIGPDGTPRDYAGGLAGTPVFLGCSDVDPHIPLDRVRETARVLGALGGAITERIYPGMGHAINEDEVRQVRTLLARLAAPVGSDGPGPSTTRPEPGDQPKLKRRGRSKLVSRRDGPHETTSGSEQPRAGREKGGYREGDRETCVRHSADGCHVRGRGPGADPAGQGGRGGSRVQPSVFVSVSGCPARGDRDREIAGLPLEQRHHDAGGTAVLLHAGLARADARGGGGVA